MEAGSPLLAPLAYGALQIQKKNLHIQLSLGTPTLFSYSDFLGHLPTFPCAAKANPELTDLSSGPEMLFGAHENPGDKATSERGV